MNAPTELAPHRVLVVDDNQANRQLLRAYLTRLGMEVLTADNGLEALEVFEREMPDIVLIDVMMPVMDGLTATRKLRERYTERWVPIVMLSALGTEADVSSGLDNGADDYLVKPISYTVFAAKMRTISRSLALQRESEIASGKLQAISNAVSDGLVTFSAGGEILSVNPAFCSLIGLNPVDLVGTRLGDLFETTSYEFLRAELAQRMAEGKATQSVTRELRLARGRAPLMVEITVSTLTAEDGVDYLGMIHDVSGRKRIEAELASYTQELQRYHEEAERENALAQEIIERGIGGRGLADPAIEHRLSPARRFSGDLVLAARAPAGQLFALLADATGHGLAAAVSVLPAVSEFYRMVELSPTPQELVSALSRTLNGALPLGRFVAAALVCLDAGRASATVWNGGMPDVFHLDVEGRVVERLRSRDLPLGVEPLAAADVHCEQVALEAGEQLFVFSDGLLEALSPDGSQLGYDGIAETLAGTAREGRLASLERAVAGHCAGVLPHDDISMLLVSA